jgi:hypothetical protein
MIGGVHVRGVKLPDLRPFALIGVREEIHRLRDEIARLEFIELTLSGALPELVDAPPTPATEPPETDTVVFKPPPRARRRRVRRKRGR